MNNKKVIFAAKPKFSSKQLIANLAGLLFVFLIMASAAMMRDHRLLGHNLEQTETNTATTVNEDGSVIVNTTTLAPSVIGYSGPVPVEIIISDNRVTAITPLENAETPGFFNSVISSGILDRWIGKTPAEALEEQVDGVTGATYSSEALIANVHAGLSHYLSDSSMAVAKAPDRDVAFYAALIVLLMAAIIPLFVKNGRYRIVQEILNVAVLGFWAGTFIDYTLMLRIISNGIGVSASIITILILVIAFIYPLFGKPGYYCAQVCPLGSLQELAARCNTAHRLHLSTRTVKTLTQFRQWLWAILLLCLWTGYATSWIDYELFTAFMVNEAATGVLVAGAVVLLLSFFITRPYCRFVCPTGSLLRCAQNINQQ